MLYIFKIVSVLTFLKIVLLIVPINFKNFANLNSTSLEILINYNIIKINTFNYPSCPISYQNEKAATVKLSIFLQITGIISRTLKSSHVQKQTRLAIYNTSALPTVLYG